MTHPMSKTELSLMAAPVGRQHREDLFVRFVIDAVVLGAGIGIAIATLILLTDTFGLSRGECVASPMHLPPHSRSSWVAP